MFGGKFKFAKVSAAVIVVMMVVLVGALAAILTTPLFTIGHLDFNLQDALGFTKTSGILQKQATRIIQDKLSTGKIPSALANDLAEHNINVGQVTANGDFVRTDTYIADIDKMKDVAVLGHYEVKPTEEGELAVLYDGQVIVAADFVNTVESNMKMFAEYTEALDISAKYYYDDEVNSVFSAMGLDRGVFSGWVDTGDAEKNKEKFNEMMEEALENKSELAVKGYLDSGNGATSRGRLKNTLIAPAPSTSTDEIYYDPANPGKKVDGQGRPVVIPSHGTTDVTGDGEEEQGSSGGGTEQDRGVVVSDGSDAWEIIQEVADEVSGESANDKAAQLLNTAISAGEPYLAASAFIAIESPIQQARIDGTGPVNELMNVLNTELSVEYMDVSTKETKTVKKSILTTGNFVAAVSGGKFSKKEAANFSRDRAIRVAGMTDPDLISETTVASDGQKKSSMIIPITGGQQAEADELWVLEDSVDKAMVESNYSLLKGEIGGNRVIEGGAFLSNMINSHVIGALASDESAVLSYNREAKTEMARMAAAERATKSPFDVSSPYTFMGSIVHGFANAIIQSHGNGSIVSNAIGTVANLTNNSAKGVLNSVVADGEDDLDYGATFGDNCDTVRSAADAQADIYCTAHTTLSTGYMDNNDEKWKGVLNDEKNERVGINLDEDGKIIEGSNLATFIDIGMERWATVGVKSAEACEKWKSRGNQGAGTAFGDFFANILGIYESCGGVNDEDLKNVATGAYYTDSDDNDSNRGVAKLFSAYALYDKVESLLDGRVSKVAELKNKLYAKRSVDNSRAGVIARISGMTKQEAEVALAYADYLTFIAKYNPAERYAFGVDLMPPASREPLVEHASQIAVDLYVMWHGRTEYDDLRTRTRVA